MNRQEHRENAIAYLDMLPRSGDAKQYIAEALVHALLAMSAPDSKPELTAAGLPVQPDLPSVMHEVYAAITPDRVKRAGTYFRTCSDSDVQRVRDDWLQQAVVALARVIALNKRLEGLEDGAAQALLDRP